MTQPIGSLLIISSWKSASKPLSVSSLCTNFFRCAYTKANTSAANTIKLCVPSSQDLCRHRFKKATGVNNFDRCLITNVSAGQCMAHKLNLNKIVCDCNYCYVDCMFKPPLNHSKAAIQGTTLHTIHSQKTSLSDDLEYFLLKSYRPYVLKNSYSLNTSQVPYTELCSKDDTAEESGVVVSSKSKSKGGRLP